MITYQIIEGAKASKNAKKFTPSPEGVAMANIPGWELLIDPDHVTSSTVQNRCIRNTFCELVSGSINLGTFANGQKAFNPTDALPIRINPNLEFPIDAWSLIFVAKPDVKTGVDLNTIITANTYTADKITPSVAFSASTTTFRIMKGGALSDLERRLTYTPSVPLSEKVSVYIVTGSIANGLAIYQDGVLVASNSNKDLINDQWQAGEWNILRGARGLFGMIGLLSIDLNDPLNAEYRNQMNDFLMQKYAIV
ncbi:hypothetical protein [Acinetobacter equi]|uniref:Uncharacterized protein n=1 Tax=Acinetobacter equi TaxID=1324350 RepID=A0A0N9W1U4_9GAMM|nr:hypothetical protein [Acinetobacter equi]ALH95600.1 hypothetical protein AOY20_08720 [Acinetobacter equi]